MNATRTWPCGCSSDNVTLTPCDEHAGPVATATNLRADDPRLNVVFAPSRVVLLFDTAQGGEGRMGGLLSRESIMKVMTLIGELDETPDPEDIDA